MHRALLQSACQCSLVGSIAGFFLFGFFHFGGQRSHPPVCFETIAPEGLLPNSYRAQADASQVLLENENASRNCLVIVQNVAPRLQTAFSDRCRLTTTPALRTAVSPHPSLLRDASFHQPFCFVSKKGKTSFLVQLELRLV